MKPPTTRPYRMKARARAAAETGLAILGAASALWREKGLDEITLQEIADRAGVTVQTVIRRFGSKEGVFDACIAADSSRIEQERDAAPVGNVDAALDILLAHYERDGDAVMRTLVLEDKLDAARAIVTRGRASHHAWCARVFRPYLPDQNDPLHYPRLDAFVAATDLYLWKLFRRDLSRSLLETRQALHQLIEGLISLHQSE